MVQVATYADDLRIAVKYRESLKQILQNGDSNRKKRIRD